MAEPYASPQLALTLPCHVSMPTAPPVERRKRRVRRALVTLIARLHCWAKAGWSGPAVGTWGLLQGSVVPGPSDSLLVPLGVTEPRCVWRLVAWAIIGSTIGGLIAFGIGRFAFEEIGRPLLGAIGIDDGELAESESLFAERGWMFVAISTFSPISTKLVCIAAGAFGVPAAAFTLALAGGRALRFLVIGLLVRLAGARFLQWVERKFGRSVDRLC